MIDRPNAAELVEAVRSFLEGELLPGLTDARLKFQTLVASHVLGIVARELPVQEQHLSEELAALALALERPLNEMNESGSPVQTLQDLQKQVLSANQELCRQIRNGIHDNPVQWMRLSQLLRPVIARKLQVNNPRFLG